MFVKSDIRKVTIALEKSLGPEVYRRLGRAGLIHLARMQAGDVPAGAEMAAEEGRTRDILAGCSFALNAMKIQPRQDTVPSGRRNTDEDEAFVANVKKTVERIQRLYSGMQREAGLVAERIACAEALIRMGVDPGAVRESRFLQTVFGEVVDDLTDLPEDSPFKLALAGRFVYGAALPQDALQMGEFLKMHGFVDKTADIQGMSVERLQARQAVLQRRGDILDRYAEKLRNDAGPVLGCLYRSYQEYEEILSAMHLSAFSAKAVFITGWMDARDKQRLVALLQEICGTRFVVSYERDPDAPVRLINMRLFRPFELIVRTMGMPANSEIDPTPLAAVTFILIFGLMFGDLGQGLILAAAGFVLKRIAGKKADEDLGHAGGILIACGLCAAFCGLLYGSFFSSEYLIPALWLHPMENIMHLFSFTILLGAVIVAVGLCLNIINAFLNADHPEALLGKRGMAVLILYVAIVLLAVRYIDRHQSPALWEIGAFIVLPLVVFALRGVLGPVLFQAKRPHDLTEYVTETVMEMMEITLSLFANTVSFIRIGAFALSHAGLSIVTYTLAGMADPALKTPAAILILMAGNVLIIGFEGLICGIQSMRLEYYEFFSKFFRGDGVVFSPFALKTKTSEV